MNSKQYVLAIILTAFVVGSIYIASDTDADGTYILTADAEHGRILDADSGTEYISSAFNNTKTLIYQEIRGYEFREWTVTGDCTYSADGTKITFTELRSDVTVSAKTRYYSTSQELINIVDVEGLPTAGDTLVNSWSIKSENLDMSGGMWKGMPCTPLIVDDVVYVRAGGMLYAMDIDTGTILNSVRSQGLEVDYYHYLSYGNGVIFDTVGGAAYDLELNKLYELPSSLRFVTYHDGFFFGCSAVSEGGVTYYTMFKTTLDKDSYLDDGVKVNMFKSSEKFRLFAQYGQFGNVQIVGDWFFFLQADGVTGVNGYRAISAFNIKTEESVTCELTGIKGMPWDDGWLTYYNGYFYVTAYTAGLFDGVIPGLEEKRSSVTWVKFDFDKGEFGEPQCEFLKNTKGDTFRGIASGLVIYNGRGYVNVRALGSDTTGGSDDAGTCMIAYNILPDGTPVPSAEAPSSMSHGGIVVNVAHADEGLINIYMLPYNSNDQAVYVFTDELKDGQWKLKSSCSKLSPTRHDWCSQAIRAGPNGELVYYVDSGYLDCYIKARSFDVTVILDSGTSAQVNTVTGSTLNGAVSSLYKGAVIDGGNVSIGGKTYSAYGMNMPSLEVYNWEKITDLSSAKFIGSDVSAIIEGKYRYLILLENGAADRFSNWDDANSWYFYNGQEYSECILADPVSIDSASGRTIVYSETKPVVDPSNIWPSCPTTLNVNRNDSVDVALPESEFVFGFEVSAPGALLVSRDGSTMKVTGQLEKNVTLSVILNGRSYPIKVSVLPEVIMKDGKTITTSETETETPEGNVVSTTSVDISDEKGSTVDLTSVTYDPSGNVIGRRSVHTEVDNFGDYVDGHPVKTETNEDYTEDSTGTKISWKVSERRTTVIDSLGKVETSVLEVVLDKIAGSSVKTESTESVYTSSIVKHAIVTTTDSEGKTTSSSTLSVESKSSGSSAVVPASVLDLVSEGMSVPIDIGTAAIELDSVAIANLKGKGDLSFSVTSATDLKGKVKEAAGNAKVFSVDLKCGDVEQHDFGKFTLTIACDITLQDGKELKVWRIDDDGKKTYATNVIYSDGKVSFDADHLSIYAIGYESESSGSGDGKSDNGGGNGNTLMFVGIGAIAVLALLGAVFMMRRRH